MISEKKREERGLGPSLLGEDIHGRGLGFRINGLRARLCGLPNRVRLSEKPRLEALRFLDGWAGAAVDDAAQSVQLTHHEARAFVDAFREGLGLSLYLRFLGHGGRLLSSHFWFTSEAFFASISRGRGGI